MKSISAMLCSLCVVIVALLLPGCGTVPESTSDTWESAPPVSATARLEYRLDSLMNENRRLQQQSDALATENRNLTARNAEIETRLNEMAAAPKPEPVVASSPSAASTGYEGAIDAFHKRAFTDAIVGFENVLKDNTRPDLEDNCHYWIGESYYGMRQYKDAMEHFMMVLNYKSSEKKDDAQLMIGNTSLAMGDKSGAKEAYNKLITGYPMSPLVSKAKEKLSKIH